MRKYAIIIMVVAAIFAIAALSQAADKPAVPAAKAAPAPTSVPAKVGPQVTCPLTGEPINKNVYTDYKGQRVYFCCPACSPEFAKNPEKYLAVLAAKGEKPEPAPAKS